MSNVNKDSSSQKQTTDDDKGEKLFSFSLVQIMGGALAAATSATLGSRLGVAGTVYGAAIGSIIAAVAGTLYTGSLNATHRRVRRIWVKDEAVTVEVADSRADPVQPRRVADSDASGGRRPAGRRRWAMVGALAGAAVSAVATFAIAMGIVTGAEVTAGRSLDGSGRTTLSKVAPAPRPSSPTPTVTATPTAAPTEVVVTEPAPSEPAPTPTATPTAEPSPEPTPTPTAG